MKKLSLFLALMLSLANVSSADVTQMSFGKSWSVYRVFNSEAVASTGTATSGIISTASDGYFGVYYIATSASGTPDVKIEYQMSWNDSSNNFVEPASATDIETSLTSETAQIKSIQPPPMPFMRIKLTGGAGNPADTVVTLYIYKQEP